MRVQGGSAGGAVFISQSDYNRLFAKGNYQCSVYVKDLSMMDDTLDALKTMGYTTLPLQDAKVTNNNDLASIIQVPIIILIMVGLFFVAYFVIRLILRSRKGYFSILRMHGLTKRSIRRILDEFIRLHIHVEQVEIVGSKGPGNVGI